MRQVTIEVPRNQPVDIRIHLKDKGPLTINRGEQTIDHVPRIGQYIAKNLEAFSHTLGGDYDTLPDNINRVRWFIVNHGYSDQEVFQEVRRIVFSASGGFEAKRALSTHIYELLVPLNEVVAA